MKQCKCGRRPDGKCHKCNKSTNLGWGNPATPGVSAPGQSAGFGEGVLRSLIRDLLNELELKGSLLYSDGEPEEGTITYGNQL